MKACPCTVCGTTKRETITYSDSTSPQTGDNTKLWLWITLAFISGSGILFTSVYRKKKAR